MNSEGEWGLSRQREGEGITGSSQGMSHVWVEREGPGQAAGCSCRVEPTAHLMRCLDHPKAQDP